jgi:hypothetical protein
MRPGSILDMINRGKKMKKHLFLSLSLLLVVILSACNLASGPGSPTQITGQNPAGSVAAVTLQVTPTRTALRTTTPANTTPTGTFSALFTPMLPNTPTWSVYNYTCELGIDGATMTMNLAWTDRSNSEEGFRVYRDAQVIASLAPNTTAYVDVVFIPSGKTVSYSIEVFNKDWSISTRTITHGCQ